MRIALLISRLDVGGAERQFVGLALALAERGHQVRMITFTRGGPLVDDLGDRVAYEPLVERAPRPATLALPLAATRLRSRLRADPPDVVYAGDYACNLLAATAAPAARVPAVWGLRCVGDHATFPMRVLRATGRPLRSRAALAIANSHASLELHGRLGYLPARSAVIPNGVDTMRFSPGENGQRRRAELGVAGETRLVGIVARPMPVKDHGSFLAAAAILAAKRDDVAFVVAAPRVDGFPPELRAAAEAPGLAGRVHFVSAKNDPRAVYRALDILVSSSLSEGFPNVVVEAMACGTPCVATDVGDTAIALGETGRLVPPGDPAALAAGLDALLGCARADYERLAEAARARVMTEFSVESLVERTEARLGEVIGA